MKYLKFPKLNWLAVPIFLLFAQLAAYSQDNRDTRLFLDVPPDTFITKIDSVTDSLYLPHQFIIPGSEKILRNNFKLIRNLHYYFDWKQGRIRFNQPVQKGDSLKIIYQTYALPLIDEYFHRELQTISRSDSGGQDSARAGAVRSNFLEEIDSFSENLQRSGSIVRGIEIGSNRDLTLNSGLNLQLSGYITPEVELVAALTDENTPLQPEGNTQTLREVDKVFVKINSPYLGGTLGDFNLTYQNSLYGNLERKLQGITTRGELGGYQQQLTYATSRGTFHTNQFLGQEGNQGPYQLRGKNGEREIIVLAGTERVYVNGERQTRGQNNHYIIDYSLGQITFTNNRLITSEDRIEVDFEYANNFQRYGKSFVGFSTTNRRAGRRLSYDLRLFREWDDTRNLLEDSAPLTDREKSALETAGDNPLQAGVNGADSVGFGEGNYTKKDTVINGEHTKYFKYLGEGKGNYRVRFTGVGPQKGSYVKERLGVYRYVGAGMGDYLPVRLVPLAGDKKFMDANLSYHFGDHFILNSETAISNYDRNVFSRVNDNDNLGQAYSIGASYQNKKFRFLGNKMGALNWQVDWKRRGERFAPLDREYQPEFNFKWNLRSEERQREENTVESSLQYRPSRLVHLNVDGGWIQRGNTVSSRRAKGQISLTDSTLIKGDGFLEVVNSQFPGQQSDWVRLGSTIGRQFRGIYPYLEYRQEDRKVRTPGRERSGFFFAERGAGLKLPDFLGMKWHFNSKLRDDFLYNSDRNEQRLKLSSSMTHRLNVDILESSGWQGRAALVYRDKNYEQFFERLPADSVARYQPDAQFQDTTWRDRQSHLASLELEYRNQDRTVDSRWEYRVASELQALQEKVFLEVGENRGNYRYDETLQEYVPDPQGSYLLIVVPTGRFESVTNIEAGWQLRYRPKISRRKRHGLDKLLHNISTFTYLRLDEKSREPNVWQLYILNPEKYHSTETTLRGSYTVNQDIYFFERNPHFGITLRSRYRDNLTNQFVDADYNESRQFWERSITWRQRLWGQKLSQETQYIQTLNTRTVAALPSRNRDVFSHAGAIKLNYRPVYAWQLQLEVESGWQKDRAPENRLNVRYQEIKPQVNYSMRGKARGSANFTYLRVEVTDNPFSRPIPFEMGKGKKEGNSFLWNVRFEYFLSSNVTMSLNYTGRRDAGAERTIHLGQAEVRAFF